MLYKTAFTERCILYTIHAGHLRLMHATRTLFRGNPPTHNMYVCYAHHINTAGWVLAFGEQ